MKQIKQLFPVPRGFRVQNGISCHKTISMKKSARGLMAFNFTFDKICFSVTDHLNSTLSDKSRRILHQRTTSKKKKKEKKGNHPELACNAVSSMGKLFYA